jgi:hypothetical protein
MVIFIQACDRIICVVVDAPIEGTRYARAEQVRGSDKDV